MSEILLARQERLNKRVSNFCQNPSLTSTDFGKIGRVTKKLFAQAVSENCEEKIRTDIFDAFMKCRDHVRSYMVKNTETSAFTSLSIHVMVNHYVQHLNGTSFIECMYTIAHMYSADSRKAYCNNSADFIDHINILLWKQEQDAAMAKIDALNIENAKLKDQLNSIKSAIGGVGN